MSKRNEFVPLHDAVEIATKANIDERNWSTFHKTLKRAVYAYDTEFTEAFMTDIAHSGDHGLSVDEFKSLRQFFRTILKKWSGGRGQGKKRTRGVRPDVRDEFEFRQGEYNDTVEETLRRWIAACDALLTDYSRTRGNQPRTRGKAQPRPTKPLRVVYEQLSNFWKVARPGRAWNPEFTQGLQRGPRTARGDAAVLFLETARYCDKKADRSDAYREIDERDCFAVADYFRRSARRARSKTKK